MTLAAKYKHDCDRCELFASTTKGDWYTCEGSHDRTVLLRAGDEAGTYTSTPIAGYVYSSPFFAAALASGLRLTDLEVREILAYALSWDVSRDVYAFLDGSIVEGRKAIYEAVMEQPHGPDAAFAAEEARLNPKEDP